MNKRKIIFLFLDVLNYITMDFDDDTHMYVNHSVCSVFLPTEDNKYKMVYFNSHGKSLLEYTEYEYSLSQYRLKKVAIPNKLPMDYFINQGLVNSMNKYFNQYKHNIFVTYETNKYYNYEHFNLQNGDAYGLCFIFPLIMWYNIIYKFDTDETFEFVTKEHGFTFIKNIEIHSSQYLLKQKNLFRFMEKIFLDYDEELRGLIFKSWSYSIKRTTTVINEYIEKKGTRFIKKLLYCIVSFIGQRRIKDKIVE